MTTKKENDLTSNIKTPLSEALEKRERIPVHKQRLFVGESRPGFVRRWVNDWPGRIEQFLLGGWSIVNDPNMKTHDGMAQVESQLASAVRRVANKRPDAPCKYAYLMEIPEDLYKADQAEKQKIIDEKEDAFDPTHYHKQTGMYGKMSKE